MGVSNARLLESEGDVYQYGRLGDMVYVGRKRMKKRTEDLAISLHHDAKVALSVWFKELEKAGKADPSSPLHNRIRPHHARAYPILG